MSGDVLSLTVTVICMTHLYCAEHREKRKASRLYFLFLEVFLPHRQEFLNGPTRKERAGLWTAFAPRGKAWIGRRFPVPPEGDSPRVMFFMDLWLAAAQICLADDCMAPTRPPATRNQNGVNRVLLLTDRRFGGPVG